MLPRLATALAPLLLAASPLLAQPAPLSVCLVQTKPDTSTQYEPSAGPWAVEIDKQLSTQHLRSGAPLHITALAASTQKALLPELNRLQCAWVIQLWYQHNPDLDLSRAGVSSDPTPPFNPQLGGPAPVDSDDSLFFTLWNAHTGKTLARGAAPLRPVESQVPAPPEPVRANPATCTVLTRQIVKGLNKLP